MRKCARARDHHTGIRTRKHADAADATVVVASRVIDSKKREEKGRKM